MDLTSGETTWKHRIATESQEVRERRLGTYRASSGASRLKKVRARAAAQFKAARVALHEPEVYERVRVKISHAQALRAIAEAQRYSAGQGDLVTSWSGKVGA